MFGQLEEFYTQYGHSNISRHDKRYRKLCEWTWEQRKNYKNNEPRLTPSKIKNLLRLNFDLGISRTNWELRFKELKAFKKRFGHAATALPYRWKEAYTTSQNLQIPIL